MTCEDWKTELEECCTKVVTVNCELITHLNTLPAITDGDKADLDELAAIVVVKLSRMNQKVATLFIA